MSQWNVGNLDRAIRMLLGFMLIGLAYTSVIGAWGYVGLALVLTGVVALCPLYFLFGWRTTSR